MSCPLNRALFICWLVFFCTCTWWWLVFLCPSWSSFDFNSLSDNLWNTGTFHQWPFLIISSSIPLILIKHLYYSILCVCACVCRCCFCCCCWYCCCCCCYRRRKIGNVNAVPNNPWMGGNIFSYASNTPFLFISSPQHSPIDLKFIKIQTSLIVQHLIFAFKKN